MSDEATWETNEVHLVIANDSGYYSMMLRCRDVDQLRRTFEDDLNYVNYAKVDWEQIFDWFSEDREGAS